MDKTNTFIYRTTIGKGRNLVYYKAIDQRPRAVYIHAIREFRKNLIELNEITSPESKYKSGLNKLIEAIDPKVNAANCSNTIDKIEQVLKDENWA